MSFEENGSDIPISQFRVIPGAPIKLADQDTAWAGTPAMAALSELKLKKSAKKFLKARVAELADAQERLYADDRHSLLLIFQARDAAGKDSTIKHVMSGVNPQGCQVHSFKAPSKEELDHNYLWRCWKDLPERGRIGIFNRSYYEEVLVVRVHPEILAGQKLPPEHVDDEIWAERFEDINAFERHMARNGTVILKFFLHVSKEEQKQRFLDRLNEPEKNWKFSSSDLKVRESWEMYDEAYQAMLQATSTEHAPWYVIPADHKPVMRALVGHIIVKTLNDLDLEFPTLSPEEIARLDEARAVLMNE
ncbi:MAG: polyphosphate kinase 2 family protein [Alphaproteobacteria bacterium]|nr:polyphosphate kinase 2 family protein [Alphaproteobacteria bacterium]